MRALMMDVPLTLARLLDRTRLYFPEAQVVSRRPDGALSRAGYADVSLRSRQLAGCSKEAVTSEESRHTTAALRSQLGND